MLRKMRDVLLTLSALTILSVFLMAVSGQGDISLIHGFNGSKSVPFLADLSTRAQVTIDYGHHEVHNGELFYITDTASLNDGNSRELLFETSDTDEWVHFTFETTGSYETSVYLYETTTKTTGTAMTELNHNRNSANAATMVVTHTPGGAGDGTLIFTAYFGADSGPAAMGGIRGNTRPEAEIVLKQNTKYLLRVTSGTNSNAITTIAAWYEHADKD